MEEKNVPAPIEELQASQLELVVSEKTIGSLTTNAKQIRELVENALPKYDIVNYSTDDVAKAKADKALLNKAAKSLNDKRIEFEKEFMAPFGEFKEVVNDTVKLIKEAVGKIDTVIKADEERSKNEKRAAADAFADILGQSAETPQVQTSAPVSRRYEVVATKEQLAALESYMTTHGFRFTVLD